MGFRIYSSLSESNGMGMGMGSLIRPRVMTP